MAEEADDAQQLLDKDPDRQEHEGTPDKRDTSQDPCTLCGWLPLKCQVLSYGLLILCCTVGHVIQLFNIDRNEAFDDYFFYIYICLMLFIFIGLILYLVYYVYHFSACCCCTTGASMGDTCCKKRTPEEREEEFN